MAAPDSIPAPAFRRIDADTLQRALSSSRPPLVIDVRRRAAFDERPERVPTAVPMALDLDPLRLPDVSRDRPVVAYCLCSGEASSSRVAQWLVSVGYREVAVLVGGLEAWSQAGYARVAIDAEAHAREVPWKEFDFAAAQGVGSASELTPDTAFLPRIAGQNFLSGRELPIKCEMAVLFVDMVDSTRLVLSHSAEEVLELMQAFMELVVDVGVFHCGDVHDFEGDGALLYFEGEAVPAAFRLRDALLERRLKLPNLPLPRLSIDAGPVVIGMVGTRFRQAVALVGPSLHRAARILKLPPPGGIIVTERVVAHARRTDPELARQFVLLEGAPTLEDAERVWVAAPPPNV